MTSQALPFDAFDLVIFGGTGDLARRKLLPALLQRFADGQIVRGTRIVATARDAFSREDYWRHIEAELASQVDGKEVTDATRRETLLRCITTGLTGVEIR